jgi:hypothetical protein
MWLDVDSVTTELGSDHNGPGTQLQILMAGGTIPIERQYSVSQNMLSLISWARPERLIATRHSKNRLGPDKGY